MAANLTPEQRKIAQRIVAIGQRRHATPKEVKAAIETGIVESNLSNPHGGDADSAGWRQERASLYSNPTNLDASINRFFNETGAVRGKYGNAGDLAAAVQRPAAQYRGRYAQHAGEADSILHSLGGGAGAPAISTPSTAGEGAIRHKAVAGFSVNLPTSTDTTTFDAAGFEQAQKRSVLANFLSKHNPHSLLLRSGALSTQAPSQSDFTTTSTEVGTEKFTVPGSKATGGSGGGGGTASSGSSSSAGGGLAAAAEQRANKLDSQHRSYLYGGGHGGVNLDDGAPIDCSAAVSAALGIDVRVSGDFEKWGRPGDGGNQGVTVYANGHHVLMKINGHFFGTSRTNPGGGAGWIPAGALSKQYLAGFTVRHSAR